MGYGHGRRVGLPTCAAWGELGVGDPVWREDAVYVIVRRDAESARVQVLDMLIRDYTAAASVHAFCGNDTHDMTFAVPPLRVDTATDAGGGAVHVTTREVSMLRGVERGMLGLDLSSSSAAGQEGIAGDTPQQRTSMVEQDRNDSGGAERSIAESSGAERSRVELSGAERDRKEPGDAERGRTEPCRAVKSSNATTTVKGRGGCSTGRISFAP